MIPSLPQTYPDSKVLVPQGVLCVYNDYYWLSKQTVCQTEVTLKPLVAGLGQEPSPWPR